MEKSESQQRKEANLIPFKPGESGNPKGRPPSKTRQILNELEAEGIGNVSSTDVRETLEKLLDATEEELKRISSDASKSTLIRVAAKNLIGESAWLVINGMLDRAHGKAIQRGELTGKDGADLIPSVNIQVIESGTAEPQGK